MNPKPKRLEAALLGGLTLLRLWMQMGANWYVDIETGFDSRLELESAIQILAGNWMGEYSKYTLCKNPAFPLFLAALYRLHIPYPAGLGCLIVCASAAFALAVRPVFAKRRCQAELVYLALLFNPVGLSHESVYHYRNALVPWTVLISIACVVAIYLRRGERTLKLLPWGILGALDTGFFWLLREDSVWFLAFLLVAAAISGIAKGKAPTRDLLGYLAVCLMPLLGILVWVNGISAVNYRHYGIYATNDRTKTYEAKVLGMLIRVDDGADLDEDVWVSAEALELARQASQGLASLELRPFENWPRYGDYSIWALRDCVTDSGYYRDARETNALYRTIYEELRAGYDAGILTRKKGLQLSDTSGLYSPGEVARAALSSIVSLWSHSAYKACIVAPEEVLNASSEAEILMYEQLLGIGLLRNGEQLDQMGAEAAFRAQTSNLAYELERNWRISNGVIRLYQVAGTVAAVLSVAGFAALAVRMAGRRESIPYGRECFVVMLAMLLTTFLNAYVVSLWDTGFGLDFREYAAIPFVAERWSNSLGVVLFEAYTTVQFLLMAVFKMLGVFCLRSIISRRKPSHTPRSVQTPQRGSC